MMLKGEKFRQVSTKTVDKFANIGSLLEPTQNDYDPTTGKQDNQHIIHELKYVTVSNRTNNDTNLKATSLRESIVWFTTSIQLVVNETWVIESNSGLKHDLIALEKVIVNDIIVGYYALIKVRQ